MSTPLRDAFDLTYGEIVCIVGAGGKTSLLIALADELRTAGWRVIVTTTTKLAADQLAYFPAAVEIDGTLEQSLPAIGAALDAHGCAVVYNEVIGAKAHGLPPDAIPLLCDALHPDAILIEADGARGLPLKLSKPDEPVLTVAATRIIYCAGLRVLERPPDGLIYNPDEQTGPHILGLTHTNNFMHETQQLLIVRELVHLRRRWQQVGSGQPCPPISLFLNEDGTAESALHRWRWSIAGGFGTDRAVRGALNYRTSMQTITEVQRAVGAVILAAGLSSRMGTMKVLLPWEPGQTVLDRVLALSRSASARQVIVTGHQHAEVSAAVDYHMPSCQIVHNIDYAQGDMLSSLQTGLRALPPEICATLVVLGDQPMIPLAVFQAVVAAYQQGKGSIIAPSYQMRRGHPILIDRQYWPEILALPPGSAPRDVINRHADAIHYVEVDDDAVLRDLDTPEQYAEERRRAGLDLLDGD